MRLNIRNARPKRVILSLISLSIITVLYIIIYKKLKKWIHKDGDKSFIVYIRWLLEVIINIIYYAIFFIIVNQRHSIEFYSPEFLIIFIVSSILLNTFTFYMIK